MTQCHLDTTPVHYSVHTVVSQVTICGVTRSPGTLASSCRTRATSSATPSIAKAIGKVNNLKKANDSQQAIRGELREPLADGGPREDELLLFMSNLLPPGVLFNLANVNNPNLYDAMRERACGVSIQSRKGLPIMQTIINKLYEDSAEDRTVAMDHARLSRSTPRTTSYSSIIQSTVNEINQAFKRVRPCKEGLMQLKSIRE